MKKGYPLEKPDIHSDYRDVFKAEELKDASFSAPYNFPVFRKTNEIPEKLIPFNKIKQTKEENYDTYVHFFLPDVCFERLWDNTDRYIPYLLKFKGCIIPDFSMCYNFPYPQQLYNCYRNRVLGYILSQKGIPVIMNVSFSDSRTYDFCTNGIEHGGVISTGSLGTIKDKEDRQSFIKGLDYVLSKLTPSDLILYGASNKEILKVCQAHHVSLHLFKPVWDSSFITKEAVNG